MTAKKTHQPGKILASVEMIHYSSVAVELPFSSTNNINERMCIQSIPGWGDAYFTSLTLISPSPSPLSFLPLLHLTCCLLQRSPTRFSSHFFCIILCLSLTNALSFLWPLISKRILTQTLRNTHTHFHYVILICHC